MQPESHDPGSEWAEERSVVLQSGDTFGLVVEQVKDYGIFLLDPEGHITTWNEGASRLTGYSANEVIGKHFSIFYPEERVAAGSADAELRLAARDGRVEDEGWRVRKDGSRYLANVVTTCLRDEQGKTRGFAKVTRDVTQRFTSSEARLRQMIEHTPAGVAMFDREMRYLLVSRRWLSDLRISERDVIGKSHYEVFPDVPERWKEIHRRCLAGAVERSDEDQFPRGDGSVDWIKWEVRPWHDERGEIGGIVIYSEVVTERKRAEESLRESEARFRTLADNIPQLAWMADKAGWIFWYNKRWYDYTGTSFETMQGWGWKIVHHPEHIERVTEKWKRALSEAKGWEDTFPLRGSDGEYRWFLSRAFPIHDERGNVVRWFGTNTDVTEEKKTQEALAAAVRARDVFLSIASHELKTPLTPLMLQLAGIARMIEKESGAVRPEKILEKLGRAERQGTHLVQLVNGLLDVSRLTENRLLLELEPLDLSKVVSEALDRLRPEADDAGCELTLSAEPSVTGRWDRVRLEQVVANLVGNAIKYGRGKPIAVHTRTEGETAVLVVRDEGIGISPEDQKRIFGRFERAVSDKNYGGFGLGLWISRQVIEAMAGHIAVESKVGDGATFTVRLPRAPVSRSKA